MNTCCVYVWKLSPCELALFGCVLRTHHLWNLPLIKVWHKRGVGDVSIDSNGLFHHSSDNYWLMCTCSNTHIQLGLYPPSSNHHNIQTCKCQQQCQWLEIRWCPASGQLRRDGRGSLVQSAIEGRRRHTGILWFGFALKHAQRFYAHISIYWYVWVYMEAYKRIFVCTHAKYGFSENFIVLHVHGTDEVIQCTIYMFQSGCSTQRTSEEGGK